MDIVSPYPLWYFLFCLLLGALLSFLLYRKDKKLIEFSSWLIGVLFTLRFLCISLLAVLLLSPLVKYFSKTVENPIIIIAQDNSASMLMAKDSTFLKNEFKQSFSTLKSKLSDQFEINTFKFDETLRAGEDEPTYLGKLTDFDQLFEELESKYANRNIGGLILISDGIYNQGINPIYSSDKTEYPIFTVATGDTATYVDARIGNLRSNKLAFLNNEFPLEFDIKLQKSTVNSVQWTVSRNGKQLQSSSVQVTKSNEPIKVSTKLKADLLGKQKYTVRVKAIDNERNTLNNALNFYIDVLDARQKVALLGIAPHPDLSAIKASIADNENYELETGLLKDFKKLLKSYDLIILHQSTAAKGVFLNQKLQEILKLNTPLLLVGGGWETMSLQFGVKFRSLGRTIKNEAQASFNERFTLFTIDEPLYQLKNFPPLNVANFQLTNAPDNSTLMYQQIGSVKTNYPLLSFYEKSSRKIGLFLGEGYWKWRINDYAEKKNHKRTNRFMAKIIQYLAVKADRSFFRLSVGNEFFENESINLNAQLFNPSYELINDPEISLQLKNEEGKEFSYNFNRSGNAYQLSIASLAAGDYRYIATTTYQGKQQEEKGVFTIKELQLEKMESEANHNLLFQLAQKSEGQLLYPDQLDQLPKIIANRDDITAVSYINEEVEDIINLKWIFFILLALLSLEWFIRKRGGAY